MSFKRKNLYPKLTADSNQPGTAPKIRISNSPSSNINIAKLLVANSTKKTTVA